MKRTLLAKRVPRQVGAGDEDETPSNSGETGAEPQVVVKRPNIKPRKSSNLRKTFGSAAASEDEEDESELGSSIVTPKRSNLSKLAIKRNASQKRSVLLAQRLPDRARDDYDDGPKYSAESLRELKESTPTTPQVASASSTDIESATEATRNLEITSKFGSDLTKYGEGSHGSSAIPSAAEIAEKKARRARLAKEQAAEDYISLDPDDPGFGGYEDENVTTDDAIGRLVLQPKDKWGQEESRLVAEDEDIFENFEEFTEDGKIHMGRKAEKEAERRRREAMAQQIAEAEGLSEDEESGNESEKERNAAFEAAQTSHGTYGSKGTSGAENQRRNRLGVLPEITAPVSLDGDLERIQRQVLAVQSRRMQKQQDTAALARENLQIADDEVRVQKTLHEVAEKFEKLRAERELARGAASQNAGVEASAIASREDTPALVRDIRSGVNMSEDAGEEVDDDTVMMSGALPIDQNETDDEFDERPAFGLGMGHRLPEGWQ